VLKKLAQSGVIRREERVVAYITGNGLKTPDAVTEQLATPFRIAPNLRSFAAVVPTGRREEVAVG